MAKKRRSRMLWLLVIRMFIFSPNAYLDRVDISIAGKTPPRIVKFLRDPVRTLRLCQQVIFTDVDMRQGGPSLPKAGERIETKTP